MNGRLTRRGLLGTGSTLGLGLGLGGIALPSGRSALAAEPRRGGTLDRRLLGGPGRLRSAARPLGHVACRDRAGLLDPDGARSRRQALSRSSPRATRWRRTGSSYTFHLRKGVKFHNGDPLTAEDVKFSFDRLRAKDSGYSYGAQVETIDSVDVVDPLTVSFKLSKPTGPLPRLHGVPGLLDRAQEARPERPRPQCPSRGQRALQVRQLPAAHRHQVRAQCRVLPGGKALFRCDGISHHQRHHGADQRGHDRAGQLQQRDPGQGLVHGSSRAPASRRRRSRARATTGSCPTTRTPRSTMPRCGRRSAWRSTGRPSSRAPSSARRRRSWAA